jgi:hypothetical protein
MYNMTQLQEVDSIYKLVLYANGATGEILLVLFLMAVFFVMLMALKKYEFDNALMVSSFSCMIISMIFVYIHLIALIWALVFLIMTAFTAFYLFGIKNNG